MQTEQNGGKMSSLRKHIMNKVWSHKEELPEKEWKLNDGQVLHVQVDFCLLSAVHWLLDYCQLRIFLISLLKKIKIQFPKNLCLQKSLNLNLLAQTTCFENMNMCFTDSSLCNSTLIPISYEWCKNLVPLFYSGFIW